MGVAILRDGRRVEVTGQRQGIGQVVIQCVQVISLSIQCCAAPRVFDISQLPLNQGLDTAVECMALYLPVAQLLDLISPTLRVL